MPLGYNFSVISPCNHCNRIDIEKKLDVLTEIKRSRTVFAHHQALAVNIIFSITTSVLKNKIMVTVCVVQTNGDIANGNLE